MPKMGPKLRKPKCQLGRRNNILGKRTSPEELLTPLIMTKFRKFQNSYLKLYLKSNRVEYLPNGVPYKVVSDPYIKCVGGTHVQTYNQPLILVSDILNETQRRNVAMHEFEEW